jgi:hypothetical protein
MEQHTNFCVEFFAHLNKHEKTSQRKSAPRTLLMRGEMAKSLSNAEKSNQYFSTSQKKKFSSLKLPFFLSKRASHSKKKIYITHALMESHKVRMIFGKYE